MDDDGSLNKPEIEEFVPQQVVCPGCGQSFHETTPLYSPDSCAHGRMFALRPMYGPRGANWSSFAADESVRHGDLLCPGCGAPYTNGGNRVRLRESVADKADRAHAEAEQAATDTEVQAHTAAVLASAEGLEDAGLPEPDGAQLEDAVDVETESDDPDDNSLDLPADAVVKDVPQISPSKAPGTKIVFGGK